MSALLTRSDTLSVRSQVATPTDAEIPSGNAFLRRRASPRAVTSSVLGAIRPNSSPPSLAKKSPPSRVAFRQTRAEVWRTRSPALCPKASLTSLKPSRSITITENISPLRVERSSSVTKCSSQERLLARPVSGSFRAAFRNVTELSQLGNEQRGEPIA